MVAGTSNTMSPSLQSADYKTVLDLQLELKCHPVKSSLHAVPNPYMHVLSKRYLKSESWRRQPVTVASGWSVP